MKKALLLIVAMRICLCSYCQMQNSNFESIAEESFSNSIDVLEKITPVNGDSLSLMELQQLNMQLKGLNVQFADYRNDIAKMCRRRRSAMIQETLGAVLIGGALASRSESASTVMYIAGAGLCVGGLITWVSSYTPLANRNIQVTPKGIVYKF